VKETPEAVQEAEWKNLDASKIPLIRKILQCLNQGVAVDVEQLRQGLELNPEPVAVIPTLVAWKKTRSGRSKKNEGANADGTEADVGATEAVVEGSAHQDALNECAAWQDLASKLKAELEESREDCQSLYEIIRRYEHEHGVTGVSLSTVSLIPGSSFDLWSRSFTSPVLVH
jgi:hypothetical protein